MHANAARFLVMRRVLIRSFLVIYCLLLGASHCVRREVTTGVAPDGAQTVTISSEVEVSYRDRSEASLPNLVLLHGSPVAAVSLTPLMNELEGNARLIVPDLPGFGGSTLDVEDYSTCAHAFAVFELMDHLQIDQAHLLGYSMGGGVALEMMEMKPERVVSIVMVSSVGVQELELLGDYTLNHAVHGLQLAALSGLQASVPHFGWMDRFPLNRSYARNFYDTDQRPYRSYLEKLEHPTMIVHGENDFLVPYDAAVEHHRLVPQSELATIEDGDHITVIRQPEKVAAPVIDFVNRVEAGQGTSRTQAVPSRVSLASEPFDQHRPQRDAWGTVIFMMVLLALATLVSEDLTCIGAGLLVARGAMDFVPATMGCLLGIFIGDMLLYTAGRWIGPPALRRAPLKWMFKRNQVERGAAFFQKQGPALVIATRFVPGTRLPTYFASGMFRAPFLKFAGWFLLAAAVWTPLLVGMACWIGGPLLGWFERFETYALLGLVAVVLILWAMLKLVVPLCSYRGRRLLLSSWRRKIRWEFWPMWLFYPPVVLYLLWLAIRYRSLTLFTAANPSIPHSGVVKESKSEILEGLGDIPEVARWRLIGHQDAEVMLADMLEFMALQSLTFPVVLKPDVGERGSGVKVVPSEDEAQAYFAQAIEPTIVQEYIGGREFGVFYYRYPDEAEGHLFSITDKRLIGVAGDGVRNLEALLLADDRAVCMAPFFISQLGARLLEVPRAGEWVALTEVGTHCRGALFLDGGEHLTESLRKSIDLMSRGFAGFYFGRYDIRVPSEEDFQQGRNLKVLELNGVTSESTNIYDPKHGLWHAYRTLFKQWQIAFEIGARNREVGIRPSGMIDLWKLICR